MADLLAGVLISADDVKELLGDETELTDGTIHNFINAAHVVMSGITGLSTDKLTQIQLWLAAHFLVLVDPRAKSESFGGDFSITYLTGNLGENLSSTFYGQTALVLDTTGTLQKATLKRADLVVMSRLTNPDRVANSST